MSKPSHTNSDHPIVPNEIPITGEVEENKKSRIDTNELDPTNHLREAISTARIRARTLSNENAIPPIPFSIPLSPTSTDNLTSPALKSSMRPVSVLPLQEEYGVALNTPVIFNNNLFGTKIAVVSRIIPQEKLKPRLALCVNLIQRDCFKKKDGTEIFQVADIVCRQHEKAVSINVTLDKETSEEGLIRTVKDRELDEMRQAIAHSLILQMVSELDIYMIGHYFDSHACAEPILANVFMALSEIKDFTITKIHALSCNSSKTIKTAAESENKSAGEDKSTHKITLQDPSLEEDTLQNKVAIVAFNHGIRAKIIGSNTLIFPHYVKAGEANPDVLKDESLNNTQMTLSQLFRKYPPSEKKHTPVFLNYGRLIRSNDYLEEGNNKLSITPRDGISLTPQGVTKIIYDFTNALHNTK